MVWRVPPFLLPILFLASHVGAAVDLTLLANLRLTDPQRFFLTCVSGEAGAGRGSDAWGPGHPCAWRATVRTRSRFAASPSPRTSWASSPAWAVLGRGARASSTCTTALEPTCFQTRSHTL
uniref:cDNA FLJ51684, moderately similar to Tyrosine-protein kinase receptor Tie-1 n=1 Tax=Homo sapiens TaxID=9606 RepID=B4DUF4_HUMAN|nr:unnamed protein product [Homo sapiens]